MEELRISSPSSKPVESLENHTRAENAEQVLQVSAAEGWKCSLLLLSFPDENSQCRLFCRAALAAGLPLYFQHAGEAKMLKRVCFKHILALEPKFRVTVACPLSGTGFLLTCLPRMFLVCWRDSSSEAEAIIYRKRKNLSKQKHQRLLHIKVKGPDALKACPQVILSVSE